jgi:hypothetical protein
MTTIDIKKLDLSSRRLGLGNFQASSYNVLHGLNTTTIPPLVPTNTDSQGMVFFTRPDMNLSYDNVILHRNLRFLADPREDSMGNYLRCLLNPDWHDIQNDKHRSSVINDKLAFIPIMSNLLLSMSEPPDFVADLYTSPSGFNKEEISFIESRPNIYNTYDLNLTFRNMEGDPITAFIAIWVEYATRVYEGTMLPFPEKILNDERDYMTRCYRITLDRSGRYLQDIYACGGMFPYTIPYGAKMGYNKKDGYNSAANEIQIAFRCEGAMYNDPILLSEFNKTVVMFNPEMAVKKRGSLIKLDGVLNNIELKKAFSSFCYPWLNETTMELEWWTEKSLYNATIKLLKLDIVKPGATK